MEEVQKEVRKEVEEEEEELEEKEQDSPNALYFWTIGASRGHVARWQHNN